MKHTDNLGLEFTVTKTHLDWNQPDQNVGIMNCSSFFRWAGTSLVAAVTGSSAALGGVLLTTSLSWSVFSVRPLEETHKSPNYYGLGAGLVIGYSLFQKFDLGAYTDYTPGVRAQVSPGKEELSLVRYGALLATRIEEKIYLGLKGGLGVYHLMTKKNDDYELPGMWQGPGGTLMIGAIHKADKENFWQLTFEITHMVLDKIQLEKGEVREGKRRLDEFRLTASYSFNGFFNHLIGKSLFRSVF